jgi:hypothetical protein
MEAGGNIGQFFELTQEITSCWDQKYICDASSIIFWLLNGYRNSQQE